MNGTLFLCKNDFALFFKRNVLKFISAFTITLFAIILAIRNAVCIDDINDFFEGSGRILIGYVRGDKGLFLFSFVLLLYVSGAIIFTSAVLLQQPDAYFFDCALLLCGVLRTV